MSRITILILSFLVFISFRNIASAKGIYTDGNYSEAGGCSRMCMRCHMGILNPKGLFLSIKSDKTVINGGDTITITATISGFSKEWNPGLAIMTDRFSQYGSHTPQEYGWEIITNSNGNAYNFFQIKKNSDSVFFWKLRAPNYPGIYRMAASGFFSDMSTGIPVQGTKRGDNSLAITVNKGNEPVHTIDSEPLVSFMNFFIFKMPVPIDSARVMAHKSGSIRRREDTSDIKISNIWQSRDNRTIIIKTEQPLYNNFTYSWMYINLNDYSTVTKSYGGNVIAQNNNAPYRIYAEFTQDVTVKEIKQYDRTEYLGNNTDEIHRINLVFFLPDNPIDLLPLEKITKATVVLTPKEITKPSSGDVWSITKLLPGTNWYDYVGNNQTVAANWSGYNPFSTPISLISHDVPIELDTTTKGKWRWEITKDFVERFKKLGGNGANVANYILRIQALTENSLTGGIGFYGSDADSMNNMPYIELELEMNVNDIEEINTYNELKVFPNPATDYIDISFSSSTKRGPGGVSIEGLSEIKIYNMLGECVLTTPSLLHRDTPPYQGGEMRLDVSSLPPGLYFVRVGERIGKFMKE